jgi:glycosyltransferase involved in cell wall biosynthesis
MLLQYYYFEGAFAQFAFRTTMTRTDKCIRVLQVVGVMNRAGGETWLMHMLRHLDRQRFNFTFFCYTGKPGEYASEIESLGARILLPAVRLRSLGFADKFRQILGDGRYDIVHSHDLIISGYFMKLAAKEKVPVRIAHSHNTDADISTFRRMFWWLNKRWIRRYATHGLAASRDAAQTLFGPRWESDPRFRVLHCGIDIDAFKQKTDRAEVRKEFGIPAGAQVVGHIGKFYKQKNHHFIIQIVAEVLKTQPNIYFFLVGEGVLRSEIETLTRKKGIDDRVIFAGSRPDVPRLMSGAMDAFLFPSRFEGLGLVLVEAQAAGLPCIISDRIPKEATVVPELIRVLPLKAGVRNWADSLSSALKSPRPQPAHCLETVSQSTFAAEKSLEALQQFYLEAIK